MPAPHEILLLDTHRPWPLRQERWRYYQEWNDALLLHWKVKPELLAPFIPGGLEIDLFEDGAWVSFVAFDMQAVRPRNVPAFAPVSSFHELNLRTYVRYKGKQGVYFLSIEAGKSLACFVARKMSQLPYRYAAITRAPNSFQVQNNCSGTHFKLGFSKGNVIAEKQPLDLWLTERYALFQDAGTYLNSFEIHHPEWPLRELAINSLSIHYPAFAALGLAAPDLCHYSTGVPVLAWGKKADRLQIIAK